MPAVMEGERIEISEDTRQKIEDITLAAMGNIIALATNAIESIIVNAAGKISEEIATAEINKE